MSDPDRQPGQSGPASAAAISASYMNRVVRSLLTSPERSTFKPAAQLASHNPLIWQASHNRTKTAVVRLLRRKWGERDGKRPEVGPPAGPHGSDNLPGMAAFCGLPTACQEQKKNVPTGCLGGGSGIRTHGTLAVTTVTVPFDRSGIPPRWQLGQQPQSRARTALRARAEHRLRRIHPSAPEGRIQPDRSRAMKPGHIVCQRHALEGSC
jgi:hypothetical protein